MRITKFEAIHKESGIISIYTTIIKKDGEEREQRFSIYDNKVEWWNCTCRWGSIGRWQDKYLNEDKKCKHIIEVEKLLKYLDYIK